MNARRFLLFFIFTLLTANFAGAHIRPCLKRQGAVDIGSGTTKFFAALVNTCTHKIEEVLFEKQIPVSFGEAQNADPKGEIPAGFIQDSAKKISPFVAQLRALKLGHLDGMATAAFRKAKNGPKAAQDLSRQLKLPILILTQKQEAEIGVLSAGRFTKATIWDIGGGSMQMIAGEQIFEGHLASVSFKNQVLEEVFQRSPKESPNPLKEHYKDALRIAQNHAEKNVPVFFKTQSTWVGIGGVLARSIQDQVGPQKNEFTQIELEKTLKQNAFLSDAQIPGDYKSTDVTNLALVLGYMKALNIQKVMTVKTSLASGWVLKEQE